MTDRRDAGDGAIGFIVALWLLMFAVVIGGAIKDHFANSGDPFSNSPPSSFVGVGYSYEASTCADGWASQSIGRAGACSYHGGVVTVWDGSDGTTMTCPGHEVPPSTQEQYEQKSISPDAALYCEGG